MGVSARLVELQRGSVSYRPTGVPVNEIAFEIALIAVLIAINGLLSGSELAIVSARRHRLQHRAEQGDAGAKLALELAAEPNRFLSTVQVGITLVGILAGAFGGATLAEELATRFERAGAGAGVADALGVGAVVLAITFLSLIFGELVPKRVALAHPERIASTMSRPLRWVAVAGTPLVAVLSLSTEAVLKIFRLKPSSDASMTPDELRMLLFESTRAGVIEPGEQELAAAALQLGDRHVSDVMTPRLEVTWLDLTDPAEVHIATVARSAHHWFPVVESAADRVVGVVALRDLFNVTAAGGHVSLRGLLKPVEFIPESLSLLVALDRMRRDEVPLAVVVDEYGGTSGIITITDILGAVVGHLASEPDEPPEAVEREDGSFSVDGRASLTRLEEVLGLAGLQDNTAHQTLAGFLLHRMGRIPAVGESIEWGGFRFEVIDMDARRIDRVLITRLPSA